MNPFEIPILLVAFNRPDSTRRVLDEIHKIRPARLFFAVDGPRPDRPEDAVLCAKTRALVSAIDWPCKIRSLFRENNLGCKKAVSSAITWFFEHVEQGIILEDDCLPDPSFFPYCRELLAAYHDDKRVMMVSGFNAAGIWPGQSSYIFSKYTAVWGWATWRRAWETYDVTMGSWADPHNKKKIRDALGGGAIWKIKKWTYDSVYAGRKDTWDYQWEYSMLLRGGLSIVPARNLIENIGFGAAGTHTSDRQNHIPPRAGSLSQPLDHPSQIIADEGYDALFARRWQSDDSPIRRILAKIKKWAD